jgi:hypothetical protein
MIKFSNFNMCIQLSLSIENVENFTVSDEMDQLVVLVVKRKR